MTTNTRIPVPPIETVLEQFSLAPTLAAPTVTEQAVAGRTVEGEDLPIPTAEELEAFAEEIVLIDAGLERLTERKEAIKQIMRRLDYGTQTIHADAGVKVTIGHNSQLNKDRVRDYFPYDYAEVKDEVVTTPKGKKVIESVTTYPNRDLYKIEPDITAIKRKLPEATKVSDDGEIVEQGWRDLYDEGQKKVGFK